MQSAGPPINTRSASGNGGKERATAAQQTIREISNLANKTMPSPALPPSKLVTLMSALSLPESLNGSPGENEDELLSIIQIIATGGMQVNADSPHKAERPLLLPGGKDNADNGPETAEAHGLLVRGPDRGEFDAAVDQDPASVSDAVGSGTTIFHDSDGASPDSASATKNQQSSESPSSAGSGNLTVQTGSSSIGSTSPSRSSNKSNPSPVETVHRSTWAFRRTRPHPGAFQFVVPGDFGVAGSIPAGASGGSKAATGKEDSKDNAAEKEKNPKKVNKSFDAFGKGIGRVWAKTVGLAKFGKSVMRPGMENSASEDELSRQLEVDPETAPDEVHEAAATIQRFFRRHSSIKRMLSQAENEETQTDPTEVETEETQTEDNDTDSRKQASESSPLSDSVQPSPVDPVPEQAAITIQRAFRKHQFRVEVARSLPALCERHQYQHRRKMAVKTIRRFWRRTKLRRELDRRVSYERNRKEVAARKVQKAWKCAKLRCEVDLRVAERKEFEQMEKAVKTIRRSWTSYRLRVVIAQKVEKRAAPKRIRAALAIQRAYRRHKTRHSIHVKSLSGVNLGDLQRVDANVVAAWRGHMLRSELAFRVARRRQLHNEAAYKIQRAWRNHVACREPKVLLWELKQQRPQQLYLSKITLQHQQSGLGSLPTLQHRSRLPHASATPVNMTPRCATPTFASKARSHTRRNSNDSSSSRVSFSSHTSRYSAGPGGWNKSVALNHTDFAPMDWDVKDEYKNVPKDDLPKFQFAKGGGLFSDFGYLAATPSSSDRRKVSGRSERSTFESPRSSRPETPLMGRSPMGSRKPSGVIRKYGGLEKDGSVAGLPEVQKNVENRRISMTRY